MLKYLLIGWFLVAVITSSVITLRTQRRYLEGRQPGFLTLLTLIQILLLLSITYFLLPDTSLGKQQSINLVEQFMTAQSNGDHDTAESLFTYGLLESYPDARTILRDPTNTPIDWKIAPPNGRGYALGEATFSTGVALPVVINVDWEWEKAQWGISMLIVGQNVTDSPLRFILYDYNIPYQTVRDFLSYFAIICMFLSISIIRAAILRKQALRPDGTIETSINERVN